MGKLGYQEIILIGLVILVMFGGSKIPEFMRGLGKGIREFNDAKNNAKKKLKKMTIRHFLIGRRNFCMYHLNL